MIDPRGFYFAVLRAWEEKITCIIVWHPLKRISWCLFKPDKYWRNTPDQARCTRYTPTTIIINSLVYYIICTRGSYIMYHFDIISSECSIQNYNKYIIHTFIRWDLYFNICTVPQFLIIFIRSSNQAVIIHLIF